jgi:hypothetical protein
VAYVWIGQKKENGCDTTTNKSLHVSDVGNNHPLMCELFADWQGNEHGCKCTTNMFIYVYGFAHNHRALCELCVDVALESARMRQEESHPNPMSMNGRSLHPKLLLPTTTPSKWQSHGPEGTRPHQINHIRQPWWSTRRYGQVRQMGSHPCPMPPAIPMKDTRSELRHEQVQGHE